MKKKYVPSGYQIITIDATNRVSGAEFTAETEDEKLLCDLLTAHAKGKTIKPILLQVKSGSDLYTGFGALMDATINLMGGYSGSMSSLEIFGNISGNRKILLYTFNEN